VFAALGDVDELNSWLGVAREHIGPGREQQLVDQVQAVGCCKVSVCMQAHCGASSMEVLESMQCLEQVRACRHCLYLLRLSLVRGSVCVHE
jgi:cob(I)alamin adenosyltransferase